MTKKEFLKQIENFPDHWEIFSDIFGYGLEKITIVKKLEKEDVDSLDLIPNNAILIR